ncbi:hypothetical protein C3F09_01225 [candidate division GN15 bacterium]|uniref:FtsX-like permease family protein n=1 Tax=candidate division GN15 bacterium TaxID=2072418 RepID=A0A855X658_9BACT|nr:MAG: hypothetical protein C3F09_01225 [candidate division GN15 bacterium]
MIRNHVITACRNMARHRVYTLINVIGLALAMTCCLLLAVLVMHEFSFDRFHVFGDRLCQLAHKETLQTGEQVHASQMAPLGPILKQDVPGIEECIRTYEPDVNISQANRSVRASILCADRRFFEVFSFPLVQGDSTTVLADPRSIVLSKSAARKWFGDKDAVGGSLFIEGAIPLTVTGIMEDFPGNSTLKTDYVVPFPILKEAGLEIDKWMGSDYTTYLLLAPNVSLAAVGQGVDTKCRELIANMSPPDRKLPNWFLQPMSQLHLYGLAGQGGHILVVKIVIAVALVILLIACINFVNISVVQSMYRSREAGLRKTLGAQRSHLILQFVGEAAFQVIVALAIAVALTEVMVPLFNQWLGTEISWHLNALSTILLLGLSAVIVSLLAGLYPAAHFSSHSASAILRSGGSKVRRLTVRKVLVVGQFSLSMALTACAIVLATQMDYIATRNLGFERNGLYGFLAPQEVQRQFDSFRQQLLRDPNIKDVAMAAQNIANVGSSLGPNVDWEGKDPNLRLEMHMDWVSYDWATTLGITMAQGRFYSRDYPADAVDGIVLNERAVALMGLKDPIGKRFTYWHKDRRIIGVVRDFFFEPMTATLKPMVLILGKTGNIVYVRTVSNDITPSLAGIESAVKSFDPGATVDVKSFNEVNRNNYEVEHRLQSISRPAVALSIVIACMGLFGMSAFTIARRTRELGVRKALGASSAEQLLLLSKEPMILVLIATALALPVAYIAATLFLDRYAYHAGIGFAPFLVAAGMAFGASAVAVSYHALRAARANPVNSLKYE